jgi:hypothetical protein
MLPSLPHYLSSLPVHELHLCTQAVGRAFDMAARPCFSQVQTQRVQWLLLLLLLHKHVHFYRS